LIGLNRRRWLSPRPGRRQDRPGRGGRVHSWLAADVLAGLSVTRQAIVSGTGRTELSARGPGSRPLRRLAHHTGVHSTGASGCISAALPDATCPLSPTGERSGVGHEGACSGRAAVVSANAGLTPAPSRGCERQAAAGPGARTSSQAGVCRSSSETRASRARTDVLEPERPDSAFLRQDVEAGVLRVPYEDARGVVLERSEADYASLLRCLRAW